MFIRTNHRVEWIDSDTDPFAEPPDAPLTSPDEAMGFAVMAQGLAVVFAIVCAVMAALHFFVRN